MDTLQLKSEIDSVDTLVNDGIIDKKRGDEWKEKILKRYETEKFPDSQPIPSKSHALPNDIAHFPGRMVAGIFDALKQINPERCAGVAPEQQRAKNTKSLQTVDDIPDMYK